MVSFMFLLPLLMAAQTIKGKVTDASGNTLPYMNVVQKGTANGTVTDDNGEFTITVKSLPAKLIISSMGFMTKEVTVANTTC
jgi:iron complex outermembrane receptor protein